MADLFKLQKNADDYLLTIVEHKRAQRQPAPTEINNKIIFLKERVPISTPPAGILSTKPLHSSSRTRRTNLCLNERNPVIINLALE
jgi:hypothetical protein